MQTEDFRISVIIPTYNRREQLERAIHSVYKQSTSVTEIIVVDDGSDDGTPEMLCQVFPEVRYFTTESKGVSAARNTGIKNSNHEWLAFLDSDDEWLPEKIQTQITALSRNSDKLFCHSNEIWIRNGKKVRQSSAHRKYGGDVYRYCLKRCFISPSTTIIHRSLFLKYGLFDEALPACEDYDMWLRISMENDVLLVEDPLIIKYAGHDDQLSQKYWGMDRFRIDALEKMIENKKLPDHRKRLTLMELIHKLEIFISGSIKRGKYEQVIEYNRKKKIYSEMLKKI